MCGIAGIISTNDEIGKSIDYKSSVVKMVNTLVNRGPEAKDIYNDEYALLGHTRLAIVDISGGRQPMTRIVNNLECTIVYNGELYNTRELRDELTTLGVTHKSTSDTETVLLSYMIWGNKCVEKLNGIFAFVIYNKSKREYFMARDHFGVKPLFFSKQEGKLLFASEIKALLASGLVEKKISDNGYAEIFALAPSRTAGEGIYQNISELKPAECACFRNNQLKIYEYWKIEAREHLDNKDATIDKVRSLVLDAIERQLVSDVDLCTFLSGGLDSSIITAIASNKLRAKGKVLTTYSIDYEGNDKNFKKTEFQPDADSFFVDIMSKLFETNHNYYLSDSSEKLADSLVEAAYARDLAGMADVDSSLLLFCREVRHKFKVALSGECADEIFGGYPWFHKEEALSTHEFPWMKKTNIRNFILQDDFKKRYKIDEYIENRYFETKEKTPKLKSDTPIEARRREIQYLNIYWFMSTLLERKDRMSMASGLEVRVPFCDYRIVQYLYNVPWELKALEGREKGLLRKAVEGLLPNDVLYRKKSPYPKTFNPKYEQIVKGILLDLMQEKSILTDVIDAKKLQLVMDSKADYGKTWFGQLMAVPQLYAYLIQVYCLFK